MPPVRIKKLIVNPYFIVFVVHLLILAVWSYFIWFSKSGHVVYVDVTEGLNPTGSFSKYFFTFDDNWGDSLAEKQRIILIYPFILFFKVTNISFENFIPLKFIYLYVLSLAGFLLAAKIILNTFYSKTNLKNINLFTALFLSSAIYLYNPWFANRLMHFGLFFSTFTLPLVFAITLSFFHIKKVEYKYLVLLGLLLGFFTTTPHTFLLYGFLCAPILMYALLVKKYKHFLTYIVLVPITFILYGAFWLLPFFSYSPAPDRVESLDVFLMLSRNSGLFQTLKLQGYWWDLLPSYYFGFSNLLSPVLFIVYFLPFFLSIYSIYYARKSFRFTFIGLLCIVLFFGTSNIFNVYLYEQILQAPVLKNYSWLFREPEKIAYILALSYSLLIFFTLISSSKNKLKFIVPLLSVVLIVYFSYTINLVKSNFSKSEVPQDYNKVNLLLEKDYANFNVAVYPQVQYSSWSKVDSSNYFINLSIEKPVIPLSEQDSRTKYFFNYLFDPKNINSVDLASELNKLGVKYVVIRKDSKYYDSSLLVENLTKADNIVLLANYETLAVYQNMLFSSITNTYDKVVTTNLGLSSLKDLYISGFSQDTAVHYLDSGDKNINEVNNYYLLDSNGIFDLVMGEYINLMYFPSDDVVRTDPNPNFAKMSLTDQNHADSSFYFYNNGLDNSQFNFDKPVVFSMGGVQVKSNLKRLLGKSTSIDFASKDVNLINKGFNTYSISYINEISSKQYNKFPSNLVSVGNTKAFNIRAEVESPYIIQPHIIIDYFDSLGKVIESKGYYPSQNYKIDITSQVPEGADTFQLILTSLSSLNSVEVKYNNFTIKDVSDNFQKPEVSFNYKNNCTSECLVFARVIKSPNSGLLDFYIDNKVHKVITKGSENKYVWVQVAKGLNSATSFKILNAYGINSVAAILVVNEGNYQDTLNSVTKKISGYSETINYNNVSKMYYNNSVETNAKTILDTEKLSSVHYRVYSKTGSGVRILTFGKPYSDQWVFNDKASIRINGFINGYITGGEAERTVSINYRPQKYLNLGLYLTLISFLFLTPAIFFTKQ